MILSREIRCERHKKQDTVARIWASRQQWLLGRGISRVFKYWMNVWESKWERNQCVRKQNEFRQSKMITRRDFMTILLMPQGGIELPFPRPQRGVLTTGRLGQYFPTFSSEYKEKTWSHWMTCCDVFVLRPAQDPQYRCLPAVKREVTPVRI